MKLGWISLLLCLSLSALADVQLIRVHGVDDPPPRPEPTEKFPWLVQVASSYGKQRVTGYGFVVANTDTKTYYVATASHLSQGTNLEIHRVDDTGAKTTKVNPRGSAALNLSDVEVFLIDPWKDIEPLAEVLGSKDRPILGVNLYTIRKLGRAMNLRGTEFLPVGIRTYVPRVKPRASDFEDFYLLGQSPDRFFKGGGIDTTFLNNYFSSGFSPVAFEALTNAPFASGMSGLPVMTLSNPLGGFRVSGLVSGRSRHHRHGWFAQTPAIFEALRNVRDGETRKDEVAWKIHHGPKDFVQYRAGRIDGTPYEFEEIVTGRISSGEGSRSDSGGGDRSDSGGGDRSDSGGGGRSDSGGGDRSDSGDGSGSSYESLGLDAGMGFGTGGALKPAVAFLAETKSGNILLTPSISSIRAAAALEKRAKAEGAPFRLRAIAPGEPILPLMLAHYNAHAKLSNEHGDKPQFPLISHWVWRQDKLTGIGTVWMDVKPVGDSADIVLDYIEGKVEFRLRADGTLEGQTGGFRPFLKTKNSDGKVCDVNLGALLMVNPELQEDLQTPQAKLSISCPEYQLYGEQYMGKLE